MEDKVGSCEPILSVDSSETLEPPNGFLQPLHRSLHGPTLLMTFHPYIFVLKLLTTHMHESVTVKVPWEGSSDPGSK